MKTDLNPRSLSGKGSAGKVEGAVSTTVSLVRGTNGSNPSVSAVNFAVVGAVTRLARARVVDACGERTLGEADSRPIAATATRAGTMGSGGNGGRAGSRIP